MKCKIPEISWHNRDPVLSVDIQPKSGGAAGKFYRLASGGTDSHVLIWYMNYAENGSELQLDVAADLTRHQRAVNVVKWSPSGELLASGDDESVIFIWKQKAESEPVNILDSNSDQDKEIWITLKVLRGHMEDVYDLSWCPNSLYIVSGSVDNSAIIWDVQKGKSQAILNDHKGFVQGVAWDPRNQYIATLSTDRYLRIFDIQTKKVLHRVSKAMLQVPESNELHGKRMRIYHDDTLQTFFRRLSFTPDAKLLITPSGVTDYEGVTHPLHTSYIFSRYALKQPSIVLPCPDQYTVAIKCCPLFFKLRPHNADTNPPVIPLPYRMIFAIATKSSVYLYDTQQQQPFGIISNIHYTRLTDITWSSDGCIIVVSSTDGFCSLITFEPGELGEEYEQSAAILTKMIEDNNTVKEKKSKKQRENILRKSSTDEVSKEDTVLKPLEPVQEQQEEREKQDIEKTAPLLIKDKELNKSGKVAVEQNNVAVDVSEEVVVVSKLQEDAENKNSLSVKRKTSAEKDSAKVPPKLLISESIASEIILDKEILSSDEKFESPEKKSRAATPISVRRHPRTPSNVLNATPSSAVESLKLENSPLSSLTPGKSPRHLKGGATPIAVRRKPRAIITAPTPIDKTALLEEAMDAWPLEDEVPTSDQAKENETKSEAAPIEIAEQEAAASIETTCDRTEDIRLVYEDTFEETIHRNTNAEDKNNLVKANNRITIENSEPKSPKQLPLNTKNKTVEANESVTTETSEPETPKQLPTYINNETVKANESITTETSEPKTPRQLPPNSNNKTPRRVALTTISTPKSKKKLLE